MTTYSQGPVPGSIMVGDRVVLFGQPSEWAAFVLRNPRFMEALPRISAAFETVFARGLTGAIAADNVIFALGRMTAHDFLEVVQSAADGYGPGALRTTRVMFERLVTAGYLHGRPDDADLFLDYHWVSMRKLVRSVRATFGQSAISDASVAHVEAEFERVKSDFTVPQCEKCGTTRVNHTWSKLDLVSMAEKAGVGHLLVQGYLRPMQHTHATVSSIHDWVQRPTDADGPISFKVRFPEESDQAVCGGHQLILEMLALQAKHFDLRDFSNVDLPRLTADFTESWTTETEGTGR